MDWDIPWGGDDERRYLVGYLGNTQSRFRAVTLPEESAWSIDVIDTWAMTVSTVPGRHRGTVRVHLPGHEYMAIRLRAVDETTSSG